MILAEAKILGEGVIFDTYIMYEIIRKLTVPFRDTDAFKLGIIDADGKVLRKRSTLTTQKEKSAFTIFDVFIFNIKKLLELLPLGKTRLASYTAALWLLKEWNNLEASDSEPKKLVESLSKFSRDLKNEKYSFRNILMFEEETAPANNVGSGNIAGLDEDPPGKPGMAKKVIRRNGVATTTPSKKKKQRKICSQPSC